MKLYSGDTYWDKTAKPIFQFEELNEDLATEILIVGGGMSGNLAAYSLAKRDKNVVLLESSRLGLGSSTANTGLLQYSSDIMVNELAEKIGKKDAVLFYEMCLDAMNKLTELSKTLNEDTEYRQKDSIYYASSENDLPKLKKEYKYLDEYDFPVDFKDADSLKHLYKINKPGALLTWHDADVNPYKFIQALIKHNKKIGVKYFENTSVNLKTIDNNIAHSSNGYSIKFENIILATGYTELYPIIKDKAEINRTYAFSTKPLDKSPWKDEVMIWETEDPYLYFRTTVDKRIIAGGSDEEIAVVATDPNIIYKKTEEISEQIKNIFPHLDFEIEYRWNALFGISRDGLPFIGRDPNVPNKYYLLGYEGNGTCYSMAGAEIISDLIDNRNNPYAHIVSLDR